LSAGTNCGFLFLKNHRVRTAKSAKCAKKSFKLCALGVLRGSRKAQKVTVFSIETDSDDLQREIIQAAIEGRAFRSAGDLAQNLFSDGTEKKVFVSTEPAGSMVAASLPMTVLHQEPIRETVQMTLFGEVVQQEGEEDSKESKKRVQTPNSLFLFKTVTSSRRRVTKMFLEQKTHQCYCRSEIV
jgi:hypothetical protein